MKQAIVGFLLDEDEHWLAKLACGHHQHVRHNPPWQNRSWVISDEGRKRKIGFRINCKKCDMNAPRDWS